MDSINYSDLGFFRVMAVAPQLSLGDATANAAQIVGHMERAAAQGASVVVFPELATTGYSCEDLFFNEDLRNAAASALADIAAAADNIVCVVGTPFLLDDGRLLNCAAVLYRGQVRAMVPKIAQPNYGEFYERRWFASGGDIDSVVVDAKLGTFRICAAQIIRVGQARLAVEVCEDLWAPEPPGTRHALAGADIIVNPSASNELVAKADYRRDLARMASARGICGYVYASSGPFESTKDVVFGGHLIAYENGQHLGESARFQLEATTLTVDVDIHKLRHDRMQNTTFTNAPRPAPYHFVDTIGTPRAIARLERHYPAHPFVPDDESVVDARAQEILSIQATGLARRLLAAQSQTMVIGLSGGLDSTLAFLVCLEAAEKLQRGPESIHALTLPGPGTSKHTLASARALCSSTGVHLSEIPIGDAVAQHLRDLDHDSQTDVVFENAQARERTQILFNYANQNHGLVVGTGDLSELALGWCTYNADHMAGYNVNASVPKTLIAYLVRWYARHRGLAGLGKILERVLQTPISPELLAPDAAGGITQETEAIIGPYELHDFFLYHYLRNGASAAKIYHLAQLAFVGQYNSETIRKWLGVFYQRFYTQQFKRTTLPPGPKVGTVSLSPRGDWRMPDEASVDRLVAEIAKFA
jgi:NAD+ synthase (glutamine-hydrolysing)